MPQKKLQLLKRVKDGKILKTNIMELKEIVDRSLSDRDKYPDIFTDDCGLDTIWPEHDHLHAEPSWNRRPNNKVRRVTLHISTFRGISFGAIHYYGELQVQGICMVYNDNPNRSTSNSELEREYPLSRYIYRLQLTRPITAEEIDANDDRFKYWYPGQLINCWNTEQELLDFAKEVFKARFTGDWELYVEYSNGHTSKVNL